MSNFLNGLRIAQICGQFKDGETIFFYKSGRLELKARRANSKVGQGDGLQKGQIYVEYEWSVTISIPARRRSNELARLSSLEFWLRSSSPLFCVQHRVSWSSLFDERDPNSRFFSNLWRSFLFFCNLPFLLKLQQTKADCVTSCSAA